MARIPLWRRYARLSGPDPAVDVKEELQFHLAAKVDDLVARGWSRDAAQQEAERQFGNLRMVQEAGERLGMAREQHRQQRDYWEECVQDFRYALRTLRKDRGFTTVALLILSLGIALNTAVFSVVNTVLLRPLPFPKSEQLTWLTSGRELPAAWRQGAGLSGVTYTVSVYEELERQSHSYQEITSYNPFLGNSEYTLTGRGEAQAVAGLMVAQNFFQTLGVEPGLGRLFLPEECRKGGRRVVLLSHGFWQQRFARDRAIVGQAIVLNHQPVTVVGVLPATFDFGSVFSPGTRIDVYTPVILDEVRNWGNTLALVGRLKAGVSVAEAQAEADVLFPQFLAAHKDWFPYTTSITALSDFVSGKLRRSLLVLWSAVGLILLLVCVNLSNLMMARASARAREFALRSALGAGRGRLIRQMLTESVVLSAAGSWFGLVLAFAMTTYLAHQDWIALPLLSTVSVDRAAMLWTLLMTGAVAVVFGVAPGLSITAGNLQKALQENSRGTSAGKEHERLRATLVIAEVALACVLLTGAGLLMRSFLRLLEVDLGFQPARAAVIKVDYNDGGKRERRGPVLQAMLRKIEAIPGVEAAGVADMLPLGRNRTWWFFAKGKVYNQDEFLGALVRIVTPGYLKAMGMRLTGGRDFTWQDTPGRERVVVINEASARKYWPGEDAVGRLAMVDDTEAKVVGVIADVREHSLEDSAAPEMYLPVMQADPEGAELVVRTKLRPDALAGSVMKTLRSENPGQPAAEFRPLQEVVDRSVSPRRFFVMLAGSFAALGLILASLGIYGVIAYSVTRQTQEIGIRMALGATAPQVQLRVMGRALRLAVAGMAAGGLASLAAGKWIEALLYGTRSTDPGIFGGVVLVLGVVALAAGYLPARRASRIDPIVALRAD